MPSRACASRSSTCLIESTFGRLRPRFGPFEHRGRIVAAMAFAVEEAIELADRGEPPRHRGRREPALARGGPRCARRSSLSAAAMLPPAPRDRRRNRRGRAGRHRACWRWRRARPPACRGTARSAFRWLARGRAAPSGAVSRQRCLNSLSGGIVTVISRGCGSTKFGERRHAGVDQGRPGPRRPAGIGTSSAFSHVARNRRIRRRLPRSGRRFMPSPDFGYKYSMSDVVTHNGAGARSRRRRSARRSAARSVVLVGMMGAGKSSIGRRLAARLGIPFVDADTEIEKAAGMTIAEIFAAHGEPYFRAGEARVIARLLDGGPQVLATGGGAFMNADTRAAIRAKGISVWLRATLDVLQPPDQAPRRPAAAQERRSGGDAAAADRRALSDLCRGRPDGGVARRAARDHRRRDHRRPARPHRARSAPRRKARAP